MAGTLNTPGNTGDMGLATSATLGGPTALVFDSFGNLFIGTQTNCLIRKVFPNGTIIRFAGILINKI